MGTYEKLKVEHFDKKVIEIWRVWWNRKFVRLGLRIFWRNEILTEEKSSQFWKFSTKYDKINRRVLKFCDPLLIFSWLYCGSINSFRRKCIQEKTSNLKMHHVVQDSNVENCGLFYILLFGTFIRSLYCPFWFLYPSLWFLY